MSTEPRFALRSERVLTPRGERAAAVLIEGERIAAVLASGEPVDAPLEDLGALCIAPGLVDSHVHCNEPGNTEWEGFATATAAAAAGGTTTIVDMPLNSIPTTTNAAALAAKRNAARGQCHIDVGFYGGLVPDNLAELAPLARAGVLGFKAFLCRSGLAEFLHVAREHLEAALPILRELGVPLLVHCELVDGEAPEPSDHRSYRDYAAARPERFEERAVRMLVELIAGSGVRGHIVHVSSSAAVELVRDARARGVAITAETCPHYLSWATGEIPDGDPRFKCAPPIRSSRHREALWRGLRFGTIATIGSDHSPCPPALKHTDTGDLVAAWGGIASLQWTLPVVWTEARARGLAPAHLAEWLARAPAALLGLERKGAIAPGRDADLVAWDPDAELTVERTAMRDRHKLTPYEGRRLHGRVERTYLRGRLVYASGELLDGGFGQEVARSSTEPRSPTDGGANALPQP
jgi:allantoinase